MDTCYHCEKPLKKGGKRFYEGLYCREKCKDLALLEMANNQLDRETLKISIMDKQLQPCPKCGKEGPNDVQSHYKIWSAIIISSYSEMPELCCRSCGIKKKVFGIFYSGILGWWGFPFGILVTPVQIVRNIIALFKTPKAGKPSLKLIDLARLELAEMMLIEYNRARSNKEVS